MGCYTGDECVALLTYAPEVVTMVEPVKPAPTYLLWRAAIGAVTIRHLSTVPRTEVGGLSFPETRPIMLTSEGKIFPALRTVPADLGQSPALSRPCRGRRLL